MMRWGAEGCGGVPRGAVGCRGGCRGGFLFNCRVEDLLFIDATYGILSLHITCLNHIYFIIT